MTEDARTSLPGRRPRVSIRIWHIVLVVLVAAVAIGAVVWLLGRDSGSTTSESPVPTDVKAVPISVKGLQTLASLGIVLYWAGDRQGYSLELRKAKDDRTYIRYLPDGVPLGSDQPYLTVATYPMKDAFAATVRQAAKNGSVAITVGKDEIAFYDPDKPLSVLYAKRGLDDQVEVYDPTPGRARALLTSGQIEPVK
jgi:hypothetical protein